jgi:hypothetical protein
MSSNNKAASKKATVTRASRDNVGKHDRAHEDNSAAETADNTLLKQRRELHNDADNTRIAGEKRPVNARIRTYTAPQADAAPRPAATTHIVRVPAVVRRQVPAFADIETLPFYRPSEDMDGCTSVAIRCRSSFTSIQAAWKAERGYVRALLLRTTNVVFYLTAGKFPMLLLTDIRALPIELEPGISGAMGVFMRTTSLSPAGENTQIVDLEAPVEDDRSAVVFFGTEEQLNQVKTHCDELSRPTAATEVTGIPRSEGTRSWFSFGRSRMPEEPTTTSTFDEIRYRSKRSYINGLNTAVAHLSKTELDFVRDSFDVCCMPLAHIDDYDMETEKRQLTVRWPKEATVADVHAVTLKLQKDVKIGALTTYITYGNIRVTCKEAVTSELLHAVRDCIGSNASIKIIPDVSPSKAIEGWSKVKKTIFVPGNMNSNKSDVTRIRRCVQITASATWKQIFAIATKMNFEVIDAQEQFTNTPLSFIAEWSGEHAEAVAGYEAHTTTFRSGTKHIDLVVLPLDHK